MKKGEEKRARGSRKLPHLHSTLCNLDESLSREQTAGQPVTRAGTGLGDQRA